MMLTAVGMFASLTLQVLQALDKLVALVSDVARHRRLHASLTGRLPGLERTTQAGPFMVGDEVTVADISAAPMCLAGDMMTASGWL